jgi:hypothetical protein
VLLGICLAATGLAQGQSQPGALTASVDRATIRVNESFTYILRAAGAVSGRFDPSALARDFEILDTRQSTSAQLLGGRLTQEAAWLVTLMPRRPGRFELPPATIGSLQSNAVSIEVLPAAQSEAGEDIFIEVELDREAGFVQAQAIYTVRLFVGIGTGRATLTAPAVDGGEAIVEKLGDDTDYSAVRGGLAYNVHERRYAIFPQSPGRLSIGPTVYEAIVYPRVGMQRQFRLSSEVVELEVKPAVAPPASHPDAVWLPATGLRIEESWSDSSAVFEQGVPKTRTLTLAARGVLETQLPEIELTTTPGLRQYADQPSLARELVTDGIEARRVERFAVIAQQPGNIELPPLELPWWNVDAERWEIARLPGKTIEVRPAAPSGNLPVESGVVAADDPSQAPAGAAGFWPWLSAALGLGWIATIALWLLRARAAHPRASAVAAARRESRSSLARQIAVACRVNDARRVRELLLEWGRLQFAAEPPNSLGALASRLEGSLGAEIRALEAALYGPDAREWRGEALKVALESAPPLAHETAGHKPDPLAPLYR